MNSTGDAGHRELIKWPPKGVASYRELIKRPPEKVAILVFENLATPILRTWQQHKDLKNSKKKLLTVF